MKSIKFPLRLFLFWMIVFQFFRLLFLVVLYVFKPDGIYTNAFSCFYHGIRLDIAASGYLIALPLILWVIYLFFPTITLYKISKRLLVSLSIIVTIICVVNMIVYHAWGTLLNARALTFAAQPKEMLASLTNVQLVEGILLLLFMSWITILFLKKFVFPSLSEKIYSTKNRELFIRIIFLLCVPVMMRGGLQQIPINESAAYFSMEQSLNHTATNPFWYLINNVFKSGFEKNNPYQFTSEKEAEKNFNNLFHHSELSQKLFTIQHPNIILIVLESWTADIIEPLNGDKGITPFFTSLADSGLLFTNIYASGGRTDQMFPSVLSGFPAQPNHSIARFTNKIEKLPMLSADLKINGYHTGFYYGGELGFANMQSYLLHGKFDHLTGKDAFANNQMNSKWGAHDEFVLGKQLVDLSSEKQPFFSMLLTLSTHEPFEVPMTAKFPGNDEPSKFRNAASYTDLSLRNYFTQAKKQSWYANTIFILVADHGHLLPRKREFEDPASHHIPLLIFGEPLNNKYHGEKNPVLGSQHDLVATVLHQLNSSSQKYIFSNDLLDSARNSFAYFNLDEAFGWITNSQKIIYYTSRNQLQQKYTSPYPIRDSTDLISGKSYLQVLYQHFLDY